MRGFTLNRKVPIPYVACHQRAAPVHDGSNLADFAIGRPRAASASFGESVTSHPPTASRRAPPFLSERGNYGCAPYEHFAATRVEIAREFTWAGALG